MKEAITKKIGMTQIFDAEGTVLPVTVLFAEPLVVTQKKTKEHDGYEALQVGFRPVADKHLTNPQRGHFKKTGVSPLGMLKEIRLDNQAELNVGSELKIGDLFKPGDFVDANAISKGKGFQGVMKRHHFGGGPASHGGMSHRRPAAAGETQSARVYRGKRSPGHMGSRTITVLGLEVLRVVPEKNLLVLKGSVPGPSGSLVFLRTSLKSAVKIHKRETALAAREAQEKETKEKGKSKK